VASVFAECVFGLFAHGACERAYVSRFSSEQLFDDGVFVFVLVREYLEGSVYVTIPSHYDAFAVFAVRFMPVPRTPRVHDRGDRVWPRFAYHLELHNFLSLANGGRGMPADG
jgi:hypothetical protein